MIDRLLQQWTFRDQLAISSPDYRQLARRALIYFLLGGICLTATIFFRYIPDSFWKVLIVTPVYVYLGFMVCRGAFSTLMRAWAYEQGRSER